MRLKRRIRGDGSGRREPAASGHEIGAALACAVAVRLSMRVIQPRRHRPGRYLRYWAGRDEPFVGQTCQFKRAVTVLADPPKDPRQLEPRLGETHGRALDIEPQRQGPLQMRQALRVAPRLREKPAKGGQDSSLLGDAMA